MWSKTYSLNIYSFISFSLFLILFANSSYNSNGDFSYLDFAFDSFGSDSGSGSAAFLLASIMIDVHLQL